MVSFNENDTNNISHDHNNKFVPTHKFLKRIQFCVEQQVYFFPLHPQICDVAKVVIIHKHYISQF
jgi:hypothetical protein